MACVNYNNPSKNGGIQEQKCMSLMLTSCLSPRCEEKQSFDALRYTGSSCRKTMFVEALFREVAIRVLQNELENGGNQE